MNKLRILVFAIACALVTLAPIGCSFNSQMSENGGNGPEQEDFTD